MILRNKIDIEDLWNLDSQFYPERMKFCIDKKRKKVSVNMEMHIDMENELYDDGSNEADIYGGDLYREPIGKIVWEAHPNIARNKELGIGVGRELTDQRTIDELFEILKMWIV